MRGIWYSEEKALKEAKFLKHGTRQLNVELYHVILGDFDRTVGGGMVQENKSLVCTMDSRGVFDVLSSYVACGHGIEEQKLSLYHVICIF